MTSPYQKTTDPQVGVKFPPGFGLVSDGNFKEVKRNVGRDGLLYQGYDNVVQEDSQESS